ncbi:MAG: hypothetical protein R3B13_08865 [Polyangiaceae bacterium]
MTLSRRHVLALGGLSALCLGAGALGLRAVTGFEPHPRFLVLGRREVTTVDALVSALLPTDGGLPAGDTLGLTEAVDEQLWAAAPTLRGEFMLALALVEYAPFAFGYWSRFSTCSAETRETVFEAMLVSKRDSFARVASAIKQLLAIVYYTNPATWTVLGYDGPWVKTAKPPPSAVRYAQLLSEKRGAPA